MPKGNNISIRTAAKLMGKNPMFVRNKMDSGELDIGVVEHNGAKRSFYISPKKFYECTGILVLPDGQKDIPPWACGYVNDNKQSS